MKKAIEALKLGMTPENSNECKIAINILSQFISTSKEYYLLKDLTELLRVYKIDFMDLKSNKSVNNLPIIKHCIAYHLYRKCNSFKGVGRLLQKDHSTIIHSVEQVNNWLSMPKHFDTEKKLLNLYKMY